jgi:hypothetical protein
LLGTEEDKLTACRLFCTCSRKQTLKNHLTWRNFDINAGSSIEEHAVKRRILGSKITCARTMEIYEKRSFGCVLTPSQQICIEERESENYYLYGQVFISKNTDLYSYGSLFVCFLFVLFVCSLGFFFFCLLTC